MSQYHTVQLSPKPSSINNGPRTYTNTPYTDFVNSLKFFNVRNGLDTYKNKSHIRDQFKQLMTKAKDAKANGNAKEIRKEYERIKDFEESRRKKIPTEPSRLFPIREQYLKKLKNMRLKYFDFTEDDVPLQEDVVERIFDEKPWSEELQAEYLKLHAFIRKYKKYDTFLNKTKTKTKAPKALLNILKSADPAYKQTHPTITPQDAIKKIREHFLRHLHDPSNLNEPHAHGDTALHMAARMGNPDIVRTLLQYGADPNAQNRDKNTPLHIAINNQHPHTSTIVTTLLRFGADPSLRNDQNMTPLVLAAKRGDRWTYIALWNHARSNNRDTAQMYASTRRNLYNLVPGATEPYADTTESELSENPTLVLQLGPTTKKSGSTNLATMPSEEWTIERQKTLAKHLTNERQRINQQQEQERQREEYMASQQLAYDQRRMPQVLSSQKTTLGPYDTLQFPGTTMRDNIQTLANFNGSAQNFHALVERLREKYKDDPEKMAQIEHLKLIRRNYNAINQSPGVPCRDIIKSGHHIPFDHSCWHTHISRIIAPGMEKSKRGEWACDGPATLQPHQHVVIETAKMIASTPRTPESLRGLVVYHGTGHGKTLISMGIAASFWNSASEIFFVTTDGNRKDNPPAEYVKNCLLFYPDSAEIIFGGVPSLPPRHLWTMKDIDAGTRYTLQDGERQMTVGAWCQSTSAINALTNKMKFLSFVNFSRAKTQVPMEKLKNPGKWVVIIDEAQNIFKTPRESNSEIQGYEAMRLKMTTEAYMKHSTVFALTATPGETPKTVLNLVNMVRPYGMPKITPQTFRNNPALIRGLVSHADTRGDASRYGKIMYEKPLNLQIPFSPEYYAAMLLAIDNKKMKEHRTFKDGKHTHFFKFAREYSIMLPEKDVMGMYRSKTVPDHVMTGYVPGAGAPGGTRYILSDKTKVMVEKIHATKGCQYAYVYNQKVLKVLGTVFHAMGYEVVDVTAMEPEVTMKSHFATKKPRILLHHEGSIIYPNGTQADQAPFLNPIMSFFRSPANKHGEYIKAVLGTKSEGLNMRYLRAVHLLAPLPTTADDDQGVGRALRLCGHDKDARDVVVTRYFGTRPHSMHLPHLKHDLQERINTIHDKVYKKYPDGFNAHVYDDAIRRGAPLKKFMECVKAHAIECETHPQAGGLLHRIHFGSKIPCGMSRCEALDDEGQLIPEPMKRHIETKALQRPTAFNNKYPLSPQNSWGRLNTPRHRNRPVSLSSGRLQSLPSLPSGRLPSLPSGQLSSLSSGRLSSLGSLGNMSSGSGLPYGLVKRRRRRSPFTREDPYISPFYSNER